MTPRVSPSLTAAVAAALRDAQLLPRDRAAAALARRYAALIERAEQIAADLDDLDFADDAQAAAIARLRAKVDAQAVAAQLGPKLLTVLAQLGMTPGSRTGSATSQARDDGPGPLDEIRAWRARLGTSKAVDPPTA